MKTVRYFCNPGKTEIAGIHRFLYKVNPRVHWQRDYPARDGKKPQMAKPQRSNERAILPEQRRSVSGTTGRRLRKEMLERISRYPESFGVEDCDAVLLIDDADCEFASVADWLKETERLEQAVADVLGRAVPFYYLLESPEVEAWFLADWEHSFGKERVYRKLPGFLHQMRKHLKEDLLELSEWDEVEWFGGPRKGDACTRKISSVIQRAFELSPDGGLAELVHRHQELIRALAEMSSPEERLAYSKDSHGGAMLGRIQPEIVAVSCRYFFAPVYRQLAEL